MRVSARGSAVALAAALSVGLLPAGAASAQGAAPAPGAAATQAYVLRAVWLEQTGGPRLQVKPSDYGRSNAFRAPQDAWAQALALAGPRPLSSTQQASLYDQFRCHTEIARTKPYWNLESWRPSVGYQAVKAAFCNPGRL